MTDARTAALRASLSTRPRPQQVDPQPKATPVGDVWTRADGYAAVDARSRGMCECRGADRAGCGERAEIHHHIAGRVGADPENPDNLLHLKQSCHERIHNSPATSYANGTMRKRLGATS